MTPIIEIRNAAGNPVAFLSPESDSIKDVYIDNELNGPCTLEFSIPRTSPKYQYLTDAYRIIADNREFVVLKPDAIEETRDGQKKWCKVRAHESWVLLQKKYPTISNDPQNPPDTAQLEITILSGGDPLNQYAVGSAAHALEALLEGTGWSLGTVDVEGIYDIEEEKINVLEAIEKVQELWGGYLVWDSINKTLSLRDEDKWVNSTGFQIRYAKNLKNITRTIDYDIVTKLFPFGENDLNIADINDNKIYLTNHQYTNEIYEGIYQNQDLHTQEQVKEKGEKVLDKLSKPRYNYKVTMVDLRTLPEYQHETFSIGDIVDLVDEDLNINTQVRIVRHRYNVFQPWKCEVEVGDQIEKLEAMIAQARKAAEYVKDIIKPNTSTKNLLKGFVNAFSTQINSANGKLVWTDDVLDAIEVDENGDETGNRVRITPGGIGVSQDGGQTFTTAMTGAGLLANTIICSELFALSSDDGFTKMVSDGLKVFDDLGNLRVHAGNYASGKYGLLVNGGEIYSTTIQTGAPGDTSYVGISPSGINVFEGGESVLNIRPFGSGRGAIEIREGNETYPIGWIRGMSDGVELSGGAGGITMFPARKLYVRSYKDDVNIQCGTDKFIYLKLGDACIVDGGDFGVVNGDKLCIEETESFGMRKMYARESPESRYLDEGLAQIVNGECRIDLDLIFLECIEPNTTDTPWFVHLTPYSDMDLYVAEIGDSYIVVRERNNKTGEFVWSLSAIRKNRALIRSEEVVFDNDSEEGW